MTAQPPRRVLIALDGSPTSMYAFQFKSASSKMDTSEKAINSLDLLEQMREIASTSTFKCLVVNVTSSRPGNEIIKACEENRMDIVIMGSRGTRHPTKRTTVGSVAHYVMQHAKLPTVLCQLPPEDS